MKEQLNNLLSEVTGLPLSALSDNASLTRDLGLDSLDLVDLVLKMEDQFHVSIPDEDYPKLQTVGAINQYIEQKLALAA